MNRGAFGGDPHPAPGAALDHQPLTLDLRALEDAGLVTRTVYPQVPVKVEYRLSEDGERLRKVVEVVKEFGLWLKARAPADAAAD